MSEATHPDIDDDLKAILEKPIDELTTDEKWQIFDACAARAEGELADYYRVLRQSVDESSSEGFK